LKLEHDAPAREIMAARIIDLARRGERSPTRLRDRVLYEAGLAEYAGIGDASAPEGLPAPRLDV
jgi:tartrate dehydratase beta subunit/fumarate hydratase class I family protein